jgi:hypothetical protein
MAHYAQLDKNNVVVQVISGPDEDNRDCELVYRMETGKIWKRTSYNTRGGTHLEGKTPFRKNFAGIGFTYDEQRDAFIPPKPYPSWVLIEETCTWKAPVDAPEDFEVGTREYRWNEETQNWVLPTE